MNEYIFIGIMFYYAILFAFYISIRNKIVDLYNKYFIKQRGLIIFDIKHILLNEDIPKYENIIRKLKLIIGLFLFPIFLGIVAGIIYNIQKT